MPVLLDILQQLLGNLGHLACRLATAVASCLWPGRGRQCAQMQCTGVLCIPWCPAQCLASKASAAHILHRCCFEHCVMISQRLLQADQCITLRRFPATFTFVLRAFSTLEGIGRALDPDYKFVAVAQPYATQLLNLQVTQQSTQLQITRVT